MNRPQLEPVRLATPDIEREDMNDGSFVLRSRTKLQAYERCIGEWLVHWAKETPDAVFLAEREERNGKRQWRTLTYAQTLDAVRRIGQGLLDLDMPPDAPVVALSDNSVNMALLALGAMHVGRPFAVVTSAYVRLVKDHSKLCAILARLKPGALYAEDGSGVYRAAIESYGAQCPVIYTGGVPAGRNIHAFSALLDKPAGPAVDKAFAAITPQTVAKLLLTSGSTGSPKMVINTHDMLCANQQMISQCWLFVDRARPVALDWLPWSHTFGTNHNFNLILRNGGSLYIDDGRPTPELIGRTLENLRDVKPTVFFNVPRGYDVLLPYLEAEPETAEALFGRLDMLFFAAAALPETTAARLRALGARYGSGRPLFFTTEWGATETSPAITSAHFPCTDMRNIGVPMPGMELKLIPNQDKFELRVRGPSVFPGYRDDPKKTLEAFDEHGFYKIGDAGRLADPGDPNSGVLFDGRVVEDFKLTTGTWVSVGTLRLACVAAFAPYVQDVVVAGHDREEIGLLLFPAPAIVALAQIEGLDGPQLMANARVRGFIEDALVKMGREAGSSQRPTRAWILSSPPSMEHGEITDKGYVNQRAVLDRRGEDVLKLFSEHECVIQPFREKA